MSLLSGSVVGSHVAWLEAAHASTARSAGSAPSPTLRFMLLRAGSIVQARARRQAERLVPAARGRQRQRAHRPQAGRGDLPQRHVTTERGKGMRTARRKPPHVAPVNGELHAYLRARLGIPGQLDDSACWPWTKGLRVNVGG